MKRTYGLEHLKRAARCIGNLDALQRSCHAERKPDGLTPQPKVVKWNGHWSWKASEVCGRHRLYRHINVPVHSGFQSAGHQGATVGSVQSRHEQTHAHITRRSEPDCRSFYERNAISTKAKRKRASLTHFQRQNVSLSRAVTCG